MRTAEEILAHVSGLQPSTINQSYRWVIDTINEARKEAIEECSKVPKFTVDRNSILSLIKELK